MTAYAVRKDVYRYGLARGTLGAAGRQVDSCLASTDTITLDGHGFETDDELVLRAIEGGTLSAPLVAGTSYYAIRLNDSTFKLAATPTGSAINITTDGDGMNVAIALPFEDVLEFYSRFVDGVLPAHAVPLTAPYPVTIVALVAELAAKRLQILAGHSSASMTEIELSAKAQLERWSAGIPIRDVRITTASTNVTLTDTLATSGDARGWTPMGSGALP